MYKVVHKPWGKEEWLELNDAYCYKRIYINAGYKTSYQYHKFKKETNYIISGTAEVWLENDNGIVEKSIMKAGDFFNVAPPKKHRVIAITDIILQEVSTPEVDDVYRIGDEFNRADGKIDSEHKTPAVLILAAGLGSRLKTLTKHVNKAMLPINNKAIISHIIEQFPKDYHIVIATGYKGDVLKDYCELAHQDRNISYVPVDNYDGIGSGPGYSAKQCKEHLQRPFYFVVADCILDTQIKVPHLDGNWLGVYPTVYPEKYATVQIDEFNNITEFKNKDDNGYDNAFIGIASIWDYDIFWSNLDDSGEIVSSFSNPALYPNFKAKQLKWFDTGNLDDLINAKDHFHDEPLSLYKSTGEIAYRINNKLIKYNPNHNIICNKAIRAAALEDLVPTAFITKGNFMCYEWESGETLYKHNKLAHYKKFLDQFNDNIKASEVYTEVVEVFEQFYKHKTNERIDSFIKQYGTAYKNTRFNINGITYPSMETILESLPIKELYTTNTLYTKFHGDLQFDNVIYNTTMDKFTYIDWRDTFGNTYTYNVDSVLHDFKRYYEQWIVNTIHCDLNKVKLLTGIIYLNMAPLHDETFGKLLWFKSIEILSKYCDK